MKHLAVAVALALSGCAWDEPHRANMAGAQIATTADPAATLVLQCDKLGFARSSDGHRLCVMRGVDRLAITPAVPYAPITILPHGAYPPLYPSNSISVQPIR